MELRMNLATCGLAEDRRGDVVELEKTAQPIRRDLCTVAVLAAMALDFEPGRDAGHGAHAKQHRGATDGLELAGRRSRQRFEESIGRHVRPHEGRRLVPFGTDGRDDPGDQGRS